MPCANDTLRVSVDAARNSVAARTLAPRPPSPTRFSGFSLNIPLFFTHSRISQIRHPRLQAGLGPAASFSAAQSLEHPFASAPPLHPLYARALEAHRLEAGSLRALVLGRHSARTCPGLVHTAPRVAVNPATTHAVDASSIRLSRTPVSSHARSPSQQGLQRSNVVLTRWLRFPFRYCIASQRLLARSSRRHEQVIAEAVSFLMLQNDAGTTPRMG